MANNRTEQSILINGLTPIVDLQELKQAITPNSYLFKKDVINNQNVSETTNTFDVNFGGVGQNDPDDSVQVVIDSVESVLNISITGLEVGQTCRLIIWPFQSIPTYNFVNADLIKDLDPTPLAGHKHLFEVKNILNYIVVTQIGNVNV